MKKIVILYPPGCYGAFIHWLLLNITRPLTLNDLPFRPTGSSHEPGKLQAKLPLLGTSEYTKFMQSDLQIAQIHLSSNLAQLSELFEFLKNNFDNLKLVSLGFSYESRVWVMDNVFTKVSANWFYSNNKNFIDFMKKWGELPLDQYQPWQLREGLACYLNKIDMPDELKHFEVMCNNATNDDYGHYIDIKNIRDDFKSTIIKLCNYCNIRYLEENIDFIYSHWIQTQLHINKDQLINKIVDNVLDNQNFEIPTMTIVDEAYVQQKLTLAGAELKCYNLNSFPTNTQQFQSLLYYNFNSLIETNFNDIMVRAYNKQISVDDAVKQITNILRKLND